MANPIEKGIYSSVGMFLFMQEKAAEAVSDLVDRGRIGAEEGRRFIEDLDKRLRRESEELRRSVDTYVEEGTWRTGLATKSDFKEIKRQFSEIEERLQAMEEKKAPVSKTKKNNNKVLEA